MPETATLSVTEVAGKTRVTETRQGDGVDSSARLRAVDTDQPRGSQPRCRLVWTGLAGFLDDSTRRLDAKVATRRQRDLQDAERAGSVTDHPGSTPGVLRAASGPCW